MLRDVVARLYPSIPHLPGSRTASDRHVPLGIARRCLDPAFASAGSEVIVQEKLDGSCVAVVRRDGVIDAFGREGRPCAESGNEARRWFAGWVRERASRFGAILGEDELLVGEWMALVHGTRYELAHEPFVPFDLLQGKRRATLDALTERLAGTGLVTPRVVHRGLPLPIEDAVAKLGPGLHGAIDPPEGLVYRVERAGEVEIVAKWVRPTKIDGSLLPENSGAPALYHWKPS